VRLSVGSAYVREKRKSDQAGLVQLVPEYSQVLQLPYSNISWRLLKSRDHSALRRLTTRDPHTWGIHCGSVHTVYEEPQWSFAWMTNPLRMPHTGDIRRVIRSAWNLW
jgi:hypothetical protein